MNHARSVQVLCGGRPVNSAHLTCMNHARNVQNQTGMALLESDVQGGFLFLILIEFGTGGKPITIKVLRA